MYVLGISAFYHDSAAALIKSGDIVAAAQEERFTRKKHDSDFPTNAITYCLREAGISASELEAIAFYEKPIAKFDRILETHLAFAPKGLKQFLAAMPVWLRHRLWIESAIRKALPGFNGKIFFPSHHESHAASAFYPSPFEEATILTLDAVGEWNTTTFGVGRGRQMELKKTINFPHSLGMLYSAFTYYTGFRVNSGEYKLMGLAPYGEPTYKHLIYEHLIDVKEDGSFRLNMDYFGYGTGFTMTNKRFNKLFGGPPRKPESPIEKHHADLAASIQVVTEEIVLKIARHVIQETGISNLCMAGGVALNCVANGKILEKKIANNLWIQPAAGDAGGSLGAALFAWHELLGNERKKPEGNDAMHGSLLGPIFSRDEIKETLDAARAMYEEISSTESFVNKVSAKIAEGAVVGWFEGRMEFGPRSLGSRSILGDPRSETLQQTMNLKIKFRESFRPFAPAVLEEEAHQFFDGVVKSPYMLLTFPITQSKRVKRTSEAKKEIRDEINERRSEIPAVTHVDYSARVQTVGAEANSLFRKLIESFYKRTTCPVLINTSFNVRGEPIVGSPEDAWRCFMTTGMDCLAIGPFLLEKKMQTVSVVTPPQSLELD